MARAVSAARELLSTAGMFPRATFMIPILVWILLLACEAEPAADARATRCDDAGDSGDACSFETPCDWIYDGPELTGRCGREHVECVDGRVERTFTPEVCHVFSDDGGMPPSS